MPNFNEGGPKDFLDWAYHFSQLAKLKHWNTEDKFLNANILLEGGFLEAFEDAAFTDDDTRMDEEFTRALRKASIAVLPVDYSETIQEELWEMSKSRSETLADYSKRFRALVRQEHTLARLHEASPMCEDALCRLYKRGLPYDWQNKYDASGQVFTTVAALVPFFEPIEQGERRLHRHEPQDRRGNQPNSRNPSFRGNNRGNGHQQQRGGSRGRGGRSSRGGRGGRNGNSNSSNSSNNNKYCSFHRTNTHNTQDCRALHHDNQQEEHQQVDQQRGLHNQSRSQQTRVEQRQHGNGNSSDEEYLFVGLHTQSDNPSPPMRVMIKLLIECARATSEFAYQGLIDWFKRFGVVHTWVSDQGPHFTSDVIDRLRHILGAHHHFVAAYSPWANSSVEVVNRLLLRSLKAMTSELKLQIKQWPTLLPLVQDRLFPGSYTGLLGCLGRRFGLRELLVCTANFASLMAGKASVVRY
ncbi:hypothetical protein PF008_g26039 [Phytophthora fragariae]|uniref:Integrase catalytic domain-containing protein n=1 Tax=Phytophthora fragariae TaxID=53985 RepID=A0A6G0QI92_9STRA|nr:hypothetical protein PF008_g26039 [Phytophthora fragariae]